MLMQVMRQKDDDPNNKNELSNQRNFRWYRDFFKQIFDFIFSLIAIIILAIPMIIIAILIKLDSPKEKILFCQKRVGKNDKTFTILKFRSMSVNAPHQMATENFENPEKYITKIGKFLRKASLDELPQLFNVLKGDMSVIGPRPLIPEEKEILAMRDEYGASKILPGITGLAQVHGRDEVTGENKAAYDGKYALNISLLLDASIFFKTFFDVIHSRGIHEGKRKRKYNRMNNNVFIIGCKGIPARYGGFETFTDNLISRSEDNLVKYYVACMSNDKKKQNVFNYHGATCKYIFVPDIGAAKAILYDVRSLNWAIRTIDTKGITGGYVYILGCTIGPLINLFKNKLKKRGFKIYLNPDGHEWKRDKWSYPVKQYLKLSESSMIKASDLTICDSVSIKNYVDDTYKRFHPNTRYISYGSDIIDSNLNSDSTKVKNYFSKHSIKENEYYLVVGRFVPENNYETET